MNTKRVNTEFHRMDVKLPIDVYTQISEIAVNSFDARVHHISGKPEITPTLIYLLQLGIESFTSGNELAKKSDTDKLTDTIPITKKEIEEMIDSAVNSAILSHTLKFHTDNDTDKNTDNELIRVENITDTNTDTNTDNLEVNTDKVEIDTDNHTDNNTDKSREKVIDVDIPSLIEKYGIKEGAIEDLEGLALLVGEVLNKEIKKDDLSRVAKYQKNFIAPSDFWLYFSAEKKGNKWVWTLKPTA